MFLRTRPDTPARRSRPVRWTAALLALAAGCAGATQAPPAVPPPPAATPAAAAAAEPAEAGLPPIMRGIGLTPTQVDEVLKIRAEVERAADPFASAVNELGQSVAGAARQCKGDSPFMTADAARVVSQGEELRGPVLDALQRTHRLLTPAQRRKLSERLIEGDDWAKRERRNASRTRDLGPVLDLSAMQMMQMLVKAGVLWSTFADRAEPWRAHYRTAITNFARDDFDVHKEPVAAVPVVALTIEFVQMGLRMLIPLLEPKQCEALGKLIDERMEEAERARAAGPR